ncbi:hypothetical protein ABZW03_06270 [Kitasatospora sp. NPDC004799]|uniref:hypothetical protein n=1 Tax=Kitasatospora sp. NPDC004799 TaxID=3154460 RepID=UPI0033A83E2B
MAEEDAASAGLEGGWAADELPLWTEQEAAEPVGARPVADGAGLPDLKAQLRQVMEAWKDNVPEGRSTAEDLRVALEADVEALQVRWRQVAPTLGGPTGPASPSSTLLAGARRGAKDVNAALRDADRCDPVLSGLEEWRQLRAVREVVGRLWRTLVVRAGEHAGRLVSDHRVSEFLRNVSIHACETIARLALLISDRLRRGRIAMPSAESLLALGNAAGAYSMSARRQGGTPAAGIGAPAITVEVPELRRMGEALQRPGPMATRPGGTSASAATARSARRIPKRPSAAAGEQPAHLRRGGSSVQPRRTPKQR